MNKVLSILVGKEVDESVIEQGFIGSSQQSAGCFINAQAVFSICNGTVLSVDRDPRTDSWDVTVEVDSQHWIRYCNLSGTVVRAGTEISIYDSIGYGYKNLMRLEYCTAEKSAFPVRILSNQLYKQDPAPILFGDNIIYGEF